MEVVEVRYSEPDGTGITDRYECGRASVQMFDGGRTVISLVGGSDSGGPVSVVVYGHAAKVVRRRQESVSAASLPPQHHHPGTSGTPNRGESQ